MICLALALTACGERTTTGYAKNGNDGSNGSNGSNGHSIVSQYNDSSEIECANGGTRLDFFLDNDDSLSASENDLFLNSIVVCNGANGLQGPQGLRGCQGAQGIPGAMGPVGAVGPQGPAGATGSRGPRGEEGEDGEDGHNGAPGLQGQIGATGPAGSSGPQGIPGVPGAQGIPGAPGAPGSSASIVAYTSSSCTSLGDGLYGISNSNTYSIYVPTTGNHASLCGTKVGDLNDSNSTFWISASRLAVFAQPNDLRIINFN